MVLNREMAGLALQLLNIVICQERDKYGRKVSPYIPPPSGVPSCVIKGRIRKTTFPRLFQLDFMIWVQTMCLLMQDLESKSRTPLQASAIFC